MELQPPMTTTMPVAETPEQTMARMQAQIDQLMALVTKAIKDRDDIEEWARADKQALENTLQHK